MRDCAHCVCATMVWDGQAGGCSGCGSQILVCANYPGRPGQLTRVRSGQPTEPGFEGPCRNFRAKPKPAVRRTPPEPPDPSVRYIPLTKGKFAIVDAEDYEWLSRYKWHAMGGSNPYACRKKNGRTILMHRMILKPPPGMVVDHINGNGLDNRKCNLRICTHAQNMRNRPAVGGTSTFKGVRWDTKSHKWLATICLNYRCICIGYFDDEIEAARAYDRKAAELFGPFAYLNFPDDLRIVCLSGRVGVRSHACGQLTVVKSEIRSSKSDSSDESDLSDESETKPNAPNPKLKTAPGLMGAFRLLGHFDFGIVSNFGFRASCLPPYMATGPPRNGRDAWKGMSLTSS
jgi:hypothetical protein